MFYPEVWNVAKVAVLYGIVVGRGVRRPEEETKMKSLERFPRVSLPPL